MNSLLNVFSILNFSFISSNIPAAPVYGVYITQLVHYSMFCDQYSDLLDRARLLTLLKQGYKVPKLPQLYGRHHELVDRCEIFIFQLLWFLFFLCKFSLIFITGKNFTRLDYKLQEYMYITLSGQLGSFPDFTCLSGVHVFFFFKLHVACWDVRYDFGAKTMFFCPFSQLFYRWWVRVLLMLFVFIYLH